MKTKSSLDRSGSDGNHLYLRQLVTSLGYWSYHIHSTGKGLAGLARIAKTIESSGRTNEGLLIFVRYWRYYMRTVWDF